MGNITEKFARESVTPQMSDRTIYRLTWLALAVSLITAPVLVATHLGKAETGSAFALVLMVLFLFVSIPLHLAVAMCALLRALRALRGA